MIVSNRHKLGNRYSLIDDRMKQKRHQQTASSSLTQVATTLTMSTYTHGLGLISVLGETICEVQNISLKDICILAYYLMN